MRWSKSKTLVGVLIGAMMGVLWGVPVRAAPQHPKAHLVILMVWDGLRPDSVSATATPNLYALQHQGVTFADHHSIYPTTTMVNAAALSTGQPPGVTGVWGDSVYLAPFLPHAADPRSAPMALDLENSSRLEALNGKAALGGRLVAADSVAAGLVGRGGWFAAIGKQGPTFLFDDRIDGSGAGDGAILISDDDVVPRRLYQQFRLTQYPASQMMAQWQMPPFASRDSYFAQVTAEDLLPGAAQALAHHHSAWLVLWQHNPDATQYVTGLGTAESGAALANCDAGLGRLLKAIARLGLSGQTDLMVVSDHGFATLKARVPLAQLLIAQGLKKATTSGDVIVIANGGSDEIFTAPGMPAGARRALLQKIAAYAAGQPWSGPIFGPPKPGARPTDYRGALAGTFSQAYFHLWGPRSPDLIISFRELAGEDNRMLTGPHAQAVVLQPQGPAVVPNRSRPVLKPMAGVVYADLPPGATTGMATHGALGTFELHAFGAASGPDFRAGYTDNAPTSNLDVADTLSWLLGAPLPGGEAAGRVMWEALTDGTAAGTPRAKALRTTMRLAAARVVMTVNVKRLGGEEYLEGASVERRGAPAGIMTAR